MPAPPPPASDAGICQRELRARRPRLRSGEKDGQPTHPDFEYMIAIDPKGIVARACWTDGKPVYAGGTKRTTTAKNFDRWYRDVRASTSLFRKSIPLSADPARTGVWVYNTGLLPAGNDELGQYLDHSQDFTTEIHLTFPYEGGERFTFRGDDDLFLFVNSLPRPRSRRRSRRAQLHRGHGCARRRLRLTVSRRTGWTSSPPTGTAASRRFTSRNDVVLHHQHHHRLSRSRCARGIARSRRGAGGSPPGRVWAPSRPSLEDLA
jgi:hypothetical protein